MIPQIWSQIILASTLVSLKAEIYIYDSVTPCSRSCLDGLVFIYGPPTVVGGPNSVDGRICT